MWTRFLFKKIANSNWSPTKNFHVMQLNFLLSFLRLHWLWKPQSKKKPTRWMGTSFYSIRVMTVFFLASHIVITNFHISKNLHVNRKLVTLKIYLSTYLIFYCNLKLKDLNKYPICQSVSVLCLVLCVRNVLFISKSCYITQSFSAMS